MSGHWLDRPARLLARHRRLVSIIGAIWFWAGIAIYARFIALPDIPPMIRSTFFWSGVAANAIWWGYLNDAIARRQQLFESKETAIAPRDD